jgi:hypothetical protein
MKCQIDLKSLLIGILLTVCVFITMGASQPSFPHHFGRYQLMGVDREARTYVIDSHTGRVWRETHTKSSFTEMETSTIASAENNK